MLKKFSIFILFCFIFTTIAFYNKTSAYDDQTTHPALTDEIVDFYNLSFPDKQLTPQQKEWVIEGSILEDVPPRWINHFYDPVYQEGWNGEHTGVYDAETVRLVSQNLIAPYGITPVSSLEWLHNEQMQSKYAFYKGDRTWERGILEMIKGNEKEAYRILGYILHLVEDASVPEHTRNDTHAHELEGATGDYGSPYEEYLKKYDREKIKRDLNPAVNLKNHGLAPAQKNSIDEYLISLAGYSNRYFFSKDTINDPKYQNPKIVRDDGNFGYSKDEKGEEFILARVWFVKNNNEIIKTFVLDKNDTNIIEQYFSRLSRQAILHGAGVIELFHDKIAEEKSFPTHPITYDFSPFNNLELPYLSFTGELVRLGNLASALINRTGSAVGAAVDSAGNFLAGIFTQDNFRPLGEVPLGGQISSVIPPLNQNSPKEKTGGESGAATNQPVAASKTETPADSENSPLANDLAPSVIPPPPSKPSNPLPPKPETPKPAPPKEIKQDEATKLSPPKPAGQPPITPPKQCSFNSAQSPGRQSVIINEVAWMGTINSANDEWIELRNISGSEINLSGWQLPDKDGQIKIVFGNGDKIPAGGFFLLERTDDDSVPSVKADQIYSGALSNGDEGLRLFDGNCALADETIANPEWPAGDNEVKKTMERKSDLSWQTSAGAGGTPKAPNSSPSAASSPAVSSSSGGGSGLSQAANNNAGQPAKILISEIQITGGTGKSDYDFIELYNPNDFAVNLDGYRLVKRTKNGTADSSIKSWTSEALIPARGYYLWANGGWAELAATADAATSATISNDNGVALRFGAADSGTIIDGVGWGEAQNVFAEGAAFPQNPPANQSAQRKFENNSFIDTDNNANDFEIRTCPSPKSESASCAAANRAPGAFFVYLPAAPRAGDSVSFDASSSTDSDGSIVSYQWDFGDGGTASSTETTIIHSYLLSGNYPVSLSVFDSSGASGTATSTVTVSDPAVGATSKIKVLVSEIRAGSTGEADDEFIELYNPNDFSVSLSGWSLKRKPSLSATSTVNLVREFASSTIPAKGFFLIAHNNYGGTTAPDYRYTNNSDPLAYEDEGVVLYDERGEAVDEAAYAEIPKDKSAERKATGDSTAESMTGGANRFSGNGYDGGEMLDFIPRETPEPQNSLSLPEPRTAPAVSDFSAAYATATNEIIFSWTTPPSPLRFQINEINASSSTLVLETTETGARITVRETGRDYQFSLKAVDADGLESAAIAADVSVPPFLIFSQTADESFSTGSYSSDGWFDLGTGFSGTLRSLTLRGRIDDPNNYYASHVWLKEYRAAGYLDNDNIATYAISDNAPFTGEVAEVKFSNLSIALNPAYYYRLTTRQDYQNRNVLLKGTHAAPVFGGTSSAVAGAGGSASRFELITCTTCWLPAWNRTRFEYTFYPFIVMEGDQ